MDSAKLLFLAPHIISLTLATILGVFAIRQRHVTGAKVFAILIFSQMFSLFSYIFEISSTELSAKIIWDSVQWMSTSVAAIAYVIFALQYTRVIQGRSRKHWIIPLIYPIIFQVLDLTSAFHSLTRANSEILATETFTFLIYDFTLLSNLMIVGIVFLPIGAIIILSRHFVRSKAIYRRQTAIIILGALIPTLGVFSLVLFPDSIYRDISPFTYALSNIFFAIGLFRFKLLDILPLAHEIIIESLPEGVVVLDEQSRVVQLNPAALTLLDTNKDEVVGQHIIHVFSRWSEITQRFIDVTQTKSEIPLEINGETIITELEIAPIPDSEGNITGRVIVIRDITEQRETEKAMREAARLSEEARLAAEQANQMKSQFLTGMSHELRTPLNAILTFSELMGKEIFGPVTEEQKDYLDKTLQSGQHLLELVNDILDITKMQADMMSLFIEDDFDVTKELKIVVDMVEQLLRDKPVTLFTTIDPAFPPLTCDKRRVRQILLNLLTNAAKFTDEGKISLTAILREDDILFTIGDSGQGIPPEKIEDIFIPFVQTESGMQQLAGGFGLGLPISRELAEAHGGKLWVDSTVGEGSVFYVTIPLDLKAT